MLVNLQPDQDFLTMTELEVFTIVQSMKILSAIHVRVCMSVCFPIQHKNMVRMSEQALVDCSWGYGNYGCDGGESEQAYQWIMDNKCIPEEDGYGPYLQQVSVYCNGLFPTKLVS